MGIFALLLVYVSWHLSANAQLVEGIYTPPGHDALADASLCLLQVNATRRHDTIGASNSVDAEFLGNQIGESLDVIFDPNHPNLCKQGKHLPELWVIGCQKCASTSFADDLLDAGYHTLHNVKQVKNPHHKGDYHIFNEMNKLEGRIDEEAFLNIMPNCSRFHGTIGSFAADLFHLTGQSDLYWEGGTPEDVLSTWKGQVNTPKLLYQFYGQPYIRKPVFVALLRGPLERFQSSYYFFSNDANYRADADLHTYMYRTGCSSASNFNEFAKCTLGAIERTSRHNSILRPCLYGQHLNEWLKYISPAQFMIIPMYAYTNGDAWQEACQSLSLRLHSRLDCQRRQPAAKNRGEHIPVSQDLDRDVLNHFFNVLKPDHQKLLEQLVVIHQSGGSLVTFAGQPNTEDVHAWLSHWWNSQINQ